MDSRRYVLTRNLPGACVGEITETKILRVNKFNTLFVDGKLSRMDFITKRLINPNVLTDKRYT
jgi:hypothetical protein